MESANIHHHQLQDHILGSSSSLTSLPSSYGVANNIHLAWINHTSYMSTNGLNQDPNEALLNPRLQENTIIPPQYSSMPPDLGFHWANIQDLNHSRTKEEISGNHYYYYSELLSSCPSSRIDDSTFSQIFPSVTNQGSLALDLLNSSSRFSGDFNLSLQNEVDGFSYGIDYLQQQQQSHDQTPLYSSNKISGSSNRETKRSSNKMEAKTVQNASKKLRSELRASCPPPFKVRKEKLGDRISALQQLVAPFGKTDTASVLTEAIGYIKFLQNQVETLSVPYMRSASRSKKSKGVVETEESKRDLKNRGLCLMPLSFFSYITSHGGAPVWPPPHFGGTTR